MDRTKIQVGTCPGENEAIRLLFALQSSAKTLGDGGWEMLTVKSWRRVCQRGLALERQQVGGRNWDWDQLRMSWVTKKISSLDSGLLVIPFKYTRPVHLNYRTDHWPRSRQPPVANNIAKVMNTEPTPKPRPAEGHLEHTPWTQLGQCLLKQTHPHSTRDLNKM